MKILLLITLCSIIPLSTFAKIEKVYDTKNQRYISTNKLIQDLPDDGIIVLGEFHNDQLIQLAQAEILNSKTVAAGHQNNLTLHWEFLNFSDQEQISDEYNRFIANQITAEKFIELTAGKNNLSYSPIFKSLKQLGGDIFGANLPRSVKQKVIKDGIDSVDPIYVPTHHFNGDADYRERFVQAMGGHVPANKIEAYFTAQCLTDTVMADTILKNSQSRLNFLVAGSFHTDFYNGTVLRLKKLLNRKITTLKLVNLTQLSSSTIQEYTQGHNKYGDFADYIVMVE